MFLLFRFLEYCPDAAEWGGEDRSRVHAIGHDLTAPLSQSLHRLQAAFHFHWAQQLDGLRRSDLREGSSSDFWKNVQGEGARHMS